MPRALLAWKIGVFGPDGPLTPDQIAGLAAQSKLPVESLTALSSTLSHPLHPDFFVGSVVTVVKQMEKGERDREVAIKTFRTAAKRLREGAALIESLDFDFPKTSIRPDDPNLMLRSMARDALSNVELVISSLERSAKRRAVTYAGDPNKRKISDDRRIAVFYSICDFWFEQHGKVTMTSDPIAKKRTGRLVAFANAVIGCLTDPSATVSGETLLKDLEQWRIDRRYDGTSVSIDD
jgi:hypothetical protein